MSVYFFPILQKFTLSITIWECSIERLFLTGVVLIVKLKEGLFKNSQTHPVENVLIR